MDADKATRALSAMEKADVTYFPLKIRLVKTGKELTVQTPAEVPSGVAFVVLKTSGG